MSSVLLTAVGYGRRVGLLVPSDEVAAVRAWLPHWWADADVEPERTWELTSVRQADEVIGQLELWIAEWATGRIFVHAGVVAINGRAVLLPGRSMHGKTTLTAALLRAGAAYGSDEYAVLAPDGMVHPYPRPLQIRTGYGQRTPTPAAGLGALAFTGPLPVAAVAQLRYQRGTGWATEPITAGTAVLRLLDNTVCARTRSREALDALIAATRSSRAVAGTRGEATAAVPAIRDLVSV